MQPQEQARVERGLDRRSRTQQAGRDLGCTRCEKMAGALECYAEYVEAHEDLHPALQRAWKEVEEGVVGFVNVKTGGR